MKPAMGRAEFQEQTNILFPNRWVLRLLRKVSGRIKEIRSSFLFSYHASDQTLSEEKSCSKKKMSVILS